MASPVLSVREIEERDIQSILDYWLNSDVGHLRSMGIALDKIPPTWGLEKVLRDQLNLSNEEKISYCTIWEIDGLAVGHCNVRDIEFGNHANMHLHMWVRNYRNKGSGEWLARKSLSLFFNKLKLNKVYCEPYSKNLAPNRTLEKIGFEFVKEHDIDPGPLHCLQPVKQWVLTREKFQEMTEI